MKRLCTFISCCLLYFTVSAQAGNAQKYAAIITAADLKKHLTVIAGSDMEGRETGTPGQRKAASYIEGQFASLGLQPPKPLNGYQQTYPIYKDTLLNTSIQVGKKDYYFGKDFITNTYVAQNNEIRARKIIFIGYGITDLNYDDYKGKNVKGKIVVFFTGEPKLNDKYLVSGSDEASKWSFPGISEKIALATQNGAAAAFVINASTESFSKDFIEGSRKSRSYLPKKETSENKKVIYATLLPTAAANIFGDVFAKIIDKAKANEPLNNINAEVKSKTKFVFQKAQIPNFSSNVIGYIEGSDRKDEYLFITGHYDHLGKNGDKIYYGADDDGSGTVSVIEMAKAFASAKAEGNGPRRTIVFMTVSGEEKGLWGSEYYSEHPVFPLNKTSADLNIDMVGRIDTERKTGDSLNYVYVIGHDKLSSDLPIINEKINTSFSNLTLDYKFDDPSDNERIFFRSDHYNFAKKGVPILFFYDGMLKADYHKPTDTVDKINWDLYEKRVKFIFLTAWEISNRDNMLKRDIALPSMN